MFGYYLELALRSLKRNKVLTGLMVLAIGLGIGASMTMITVLHVMSGDPVPRRSATLFVPMLDAWPAALNRIGPDRVAHRRTFMALRASNVSPVVATRSV